MLVSWEARAECRMPGEKRDRIVREVVMMDSACGVEIKTPDDKTQGESEKAGSPICLETGSVR